MPLEIVLQILDLAAFDHDGNADNDLLRACSLVCRSWSSHAQRLLFRKVTLRSQRGYIAFTQAVERCTERGRLLGDVVRQLDVTVDHNQPYGLSSYTFAAAVSLCPNVSTLGLSLYGHSQSSAPGDDVASSSNRVRSTVTSFDDTSLDMLRQGPRIKSLHLNNWSSDRTCLLHLLGVWSSSLTSLSISGLPPDLLSPASEPFLGALHELTMNISPSPSLIFFKWLLHNAADSLRTLHFSRMPDAHVAEYLLDTYRATLQNVWLPACPNTLAYSGALKRCENLTQLHVERLSGMAPMSCKKLLAGSLEHLSFGLEKDVSLMPIVEIVRTKAQIKSLCLLLWNGASGHPELAPLQIACAYRGLDLTVTDDVGIFRSMIRRQHTVC